MPNVTLARALKTKSRLASRLKELQEFIVKYNSMLEGSERAASVTEAYETYKMHALLLAQVKAAIQVANAPIQTKIFELSELRNQKVFLQRLPTTNGPANIGYTGEIAQHEAELKGAFVNEELKVIVKRLEELQDEIDEFNAKTTLQLPEIPD
ncbi:hypothetical protein C0431_12130 [bacterium]|jgi:hypothetical protein|nr:hypothetical protein [bacterium]